MDVRSGLSGIGMRQLASALGEAAIVDDRKIKLAIMDDRGNHAAMLSSHLSSDAAAVPLMEMMRSPDHW